MKISSASRVHKNEWSDEGIRFFRSSDIVAAYKKQENTPAYISESLYNKLVGQSGTPLKGDLLITGGGSIGIPYLINSVFPLYFKDADVIWVQQSDRLNLSYLYFYMQTTTFRHYLSEISHVGTIAHYTIEQATNTPIDVSSNDEQIRISYFLNRLDQIIASNQRKLEKLQELKKGYLQKMFC